MVLMSNPAAVASSTGAAASSSLAEWAQQYSVETTPLGRGSFASVYKGVNRETKEPVAIKVMTKARLGERALQMLAGEISILRTLEHPNVVCLRDSHTTERRILIVLEFCGGGDLGQYIQARGPSPEATARHFMLQLAAGLAFLCSRRLIHRDIKPQNLLLSERSSRASLKIADFGLARHLPQGSLAESMLGSPLYMAPEVLGNRAYDAKADLWSTGAVLYELVTAKHPFGGANQTELIDNIRRNRPRLPPGVTLSPACVELLGMLLVPQPSERASLQTFLSCSFLGSVETTSRSGVGGGGGGDVRNNSAASPRTQQLPPLPSPRVPAEPKLSVHPTPPFEVVPATERLPDGGVHPAGNAPQQSRLRSSPESRDPGMGQGPGVQEGAGGARSAAVSRIGGGGGGGGGDGGGEESPGAQASQRRVGSALAPPSSGRLVGESNAATAASGSGSGGVGSAAVAAVSAGGSDVAAGAGVPAAGVRYSSGGVDPRGASGSSGRERVDHKVSTDAVGGRDGEWGWDWGRRGAPAGSGEAAAAAGGVASGQIGGIAIGISDEGPLPSLPALPFALEPLGMPRSFAEAGGGVSGDDGLAAPPVFAFDLAFARSPVRDRSPTAAGGVRGRRSFSVSDADTAGEAPRLPAGPDMSRRKRIEGEVGSVVEGTSAVASRSAPPPAVVGAAADAATAAAAAAAAAAATPSRRRSHSFSGQGLAPGQTRPTEAANSRSESPGARKTFATSGGSGGRSGAPEPVVYLGRAGSVSGLSVSPVYGQSSPVRRIPPERSGDGTTGILTPPSPAYYVSGGEASGGGGSGGGGSGSGAAGGNEGQVAMSPQRGYPSPVSACHQSTSPTSPGGSGQQPQQQQHYHQQYQHQSTPTLQPGTMPGGGGGGGGGGTADAGLPMLIKPSFRGSDSLLTIPEDSTGFVLVTRPPSISCEHGPGCECWAWSAGGGGGAGGLGVAVRSPSASYLASANPYGGPGKAAAAASAAAAAAAAAAGAGRRSGGVAFLGLGNIWNTAVNTFRGVAGAHGRRTSWPTRRGGAAGQQQQRGSLASVPPPTASAVPPGVGGGAGPGPGAGASGGSSREYLSPRSAQAQYRNASGGAGISSGASGGGSRSGSSSSGGSSSGSVGGGRCGGRNDPSLVQQGAQGLLPVDSSVRSDAVYLQQHHPGGVMLASPADEAGSRTAQRPQPRGSNNNPPQPQQAHHHRRHSEPTAPRPYPSGPERGGVGGRSAASLAWSPAEAAEARRVGAAADRAEVAGKRSILVVTLADKTAQEAMALALESPRDSRGASAAGAGASPPAPAAVKHVGGASILHAKRRHGMLTEALSLYVRALSILQGALPAVLVECDGVSADRFAAWNPLGAHHQQQQQQLQRQQQQQEQQQQRFGRSSPPSPALLSQRSALVTKASWLKDLFSQTLDRAEHCRTQASVASAAAASAATAASSSPSASSGEGASGSTGGSSSTAFTKDGRAFGPGAPWATLGGGGGSSGGASGTSPPPSDAAAAAVYRSAMEHGQEAAVCYLLGRSDAAVTHYVRACALLQLLALEPEMAGTSAEEGGLRSGGGGGSSGCEVDRAGGMHARGGKGQEQPQQQQRAGWQAQLLATADMYARRVELISRGDVTAERQGFVYEEGRIG